MTKNQDEAINALLTQFNIASYDLLLIGDGSGSMSNYPIGWACIAVEKDVMTPKIFYGAANDGTINQAEPLAYLIPLSWYAAKLNNVDGKPKSRAVRQVHIFTDSTYVRDLGNVNTVTTSCNTLLWAAFGLLVRQGLILHWHWIERETNPLNHTVDLLSKAARTLIKNNLITTGET
jgi:ribonuclease HI